VTRPRTRWTRRRILSRLGLYTVLTSIAVVMAFPFVFMFFSSFKEAQDIYNYPPRILPRSHDTIALEDLDEELLLYRISVEDRRRTMALVESGVQVGIFAPADDLDAAVTRSMSEVSPTGGFLNPVEIVVAGEARPVYDVEVDGETRELVLLRRTTVGRFVAVDDPDLVVEANSRTADRVESFTARPANYTDVLQLRSLDRSLTNTMLVTLIVVIGQLFTSIMGGYAFARLRFPGRDQLFLIYLGSIMIPFVVLIIPLYQLMVAIGWVNRLASLTLPWVFTAYGTFLMRQFFMNVPTELEEAALVDGASRWRVLWRVFVPLSFPAIATLAVFSFQYAWNSFVWPFIVISAGNTENQVLTTSLQALGGQAAESPNLIFAGVTIAVSVPILIFVLAQRYFVESFARTGIK